MTQTARVPGPRPMPDILRKAVPLKLPESRRRLAQRAQLCDLPRWCVRHALRMLTSVCRGGVPAPSRNPLSGAPLSRLILDFAGAFAHAAAHARRVPALGCAEVVCQANWHKAGGGSPPERRPNRATFPREPCAGSREGAGEASVAVRTGRAMEHRNHIRSGCRGFHFG